MPDIFISYSRKDSSHALELAERLRASGMGIDQHGIEAATQWSKEIVDAIESCKVFLLLLSEHSITSKNVIQELNIASETERRIIPIEIEQVTLPSSFRYQLAGLQRAQVADHESIQRALARLGITGKDEGGGMKDEGGEGNPSAFIPQPSSLTKSQRVRLAVLPFEDLSPTKDHDWFSDGLTYELIDTLNKLTELFVVDKQTIRDYKNSTLKPKALARELDVRYIVHGAVLKAGNRLRIQCDLIDAAASETLWSERYNGEMEDIFELQERVAKEIADGLKLKLTPEESKKLKERATLNVEAYELFIQAQKFYRIQSKESLHYAIALLSDAIKLDPNYARAYDMKALSLTILYRGFDMNPSYLIEAEELIEQARRLKPNLWSVLLPLSTIRQLQGRLDEAERYALEYVEKAPAESMSHFTVGFLYMNTGRQAEAIPRFEETLRLNPTELIALWNVVIASKAIGDTEKSKAWALEGIPAFERQLNLNPGNDGDRAHLAALYFFAGRIDDSKKMVAHATEVVREGSSLFNLACTCIDLEDYSLALKLFRKAIEAGFTNPHALREFLGEDFGAKTDTDEYRETRALVESLTSGHD